MYRLTKNTKRKYLYIQVSTRCHMQMFWQVRAHPTHACTCAKRYLHYTAPSLLVFHVGSIAIRRVSVSYWEPWLNVNFLRWRGGSFRGWFFCHWLVVIAVQQLYMFSCWLKINLSLGRCRRSTILSILSGRTHTWFQPVEVNNLSFLSTLKAFDFVIAFAQAFNNLQWPFPGVELYQNTGAERFPVDSLIV